MQPTTIPVDLNSWSRRDYFYYFTKMMPTGFNVNVDVDITATYDAVRAADYHFFSCLLVLSDESDSRSARVYDGDARWPVGTVH